jgi:hypothetical protein
MGLSEIIPDTKKKVNSNTLSISHLVNFFEELDSLLPNAENNKDIEKKGLIIAEFLGYYYDFKFKKTLYDELEILSEKLPNLKKYFDKLKNGIFLNLATKGKNTELEKGKRKELLQVTDGDKFLGSIIIAYLNKYIKNPTHILFKNQTTQVDVERVRDETIYFIHTGSSKLTDFGKITAHCDLIVPEKVHNSIVKKRKIKELNRNRIERWIQAFIDSKRLILEDLGENEKKNHWMWYMFPTENPGRSYPRKIKITKSELAIAFEKGSRFIFFISDWLNMLQKISEKKIQNYKWLPDEDIGRYNYFSKLFLEEFGYEDQESPKTEYRTVYRKNQVRNRSRRSKLVIGSPIKLSKKLRIKKQKESDFVKKTREIIKLLDIFYSTL